MSLSQRTGCTPPKVVGVTPLHDIFPSFPGSFTWISISHSQAQLPSDTRHTLSSEICTDGLARVRFALFHTEVDDGLAMDSVYTTLWINLYDQAMPCSPSGLDLLSSCTSKA